MTDDLRPSAGGPAPNGAPADAPAGPSRRAEDAAIVLFGSDRRAAQGIAADLRTFQPTPEQLENAAFVIDVGADDALVVPAADAHLLPRGQGGADLQARAAAMVQALRRERDWIRRRLRMPDFLLGYAEALQQATRESDVYEALRGTTVPVVGAYTAVVFVAVGRGAGSQYFPLADPALLAGLEPLPAACAQQIREHVLLTRSDLEANPASPLAPLAAVLEAAGGAQLLCAPVGPDAVLVLVERRRDRVLTGEDRDLFGALIRQAEAALRRILSERQLGGRSG